MCYEILIYPTYLAVNSGDIHVVVGVSCEEGGGGTCVSPALP